MPCKVKDKDTKPVQAITKVNMRIIPKGCMRAAYTDGWGDYWVDEKGILQIRAVEFENFMFSHYVLLHEYLEAVRCYRDGITLGAIEQWDADHPDDDDPGHLDGCPYRKHHQLSETLERVACAQDGFDWDQYDNSLPK